MRYQRLLSHYEAEWVHHPVQGMCLTAPMGRGAENCTGGGALDRSVSHLRLRRQAKRTFVSPAYECAEERMDGQRTFYGCGASI